LTINQCKCKLAAPTHYCCRYFPRPIQRRIVTSKTIPAAEAVAEPTADFERSLAELEAIVDKLEEGDLSLDDSLRQFERGVQLTRACQGALKQAEQKVEILLRRSGADDFAAAPFDSEEDSER
jgi:exodeoxyribonuclease VII small subunit